MGSFWGHILPGSMFLFVGLWHLFASSYSFVKSLELGDPSFFRARAWHPVTCLPGHWTMLELYAIIFGTAADMCVELLFGTHFRWFDQQGRIAPNHHLNNFEHGAMLLMFFIFACTAVLDRIRLLPLADGSLHVVVAFAFMSELLLFFFHSTSHMGMEGRFHLLLVLLILTCLGCALALAWQPQSFLIDTLGNVALCLQGLWFYQTAFSLYSPAHLPPNCHLDWTSEIHCDSEAATMYGMQMANLMFSWHVAGTVIFALLVYALSFRCIEHKWLSMNYVGGVDKHALPLARNQDEDLSDSTLGLDMGK